MITELLFGASITGIFGILVFVTRHFWMQTKCFHLMQQKLEQLESEIRKSKERDIEIFNRLNILDKSISNVIGKLDILIRKN